MPDCVFCKIADHAIAVTPLLETSEVIAFADQHPQAPVHVLVIPKRHVVNLAATGEADAALLGLLLRGAAEVAERSGIAGSGYRVALNSGINGGQSVDHLHLHVLGGRPMGWPPG